MELWFAISVPKDMPLTMGGDQRSSVRGTETAGIRASGVTSHPSAGRGRMEFLFWSPFLTFGNARWR